MRKDKTVSLDDLATGIIAGLSYLGYRSVGVKKFDVNCVEVFREWSEDLGGEFEFTFYLAINQWYEDSPDFRAAIRDAVYIRDLGFFTDTALAFNIPQDYAVKYLEQLPGDDYAVWVDLAKRITRKHPTVSKQVLY